MYRIEMKKSRKNGHMKKRNKRRRKKRQHQQKKYSKISFYSHFSGSMTEWSKTHRNHRKEKQKCVQNRYILRYYYRIMRGHACTFERTIFFLVSPAPPLFSFFVLRVILRKVSYFHKNRSFFFSHFIYCYSCICSSVPSKCRYVNRRRGKMKKKQKKRRKYGNKSRNLFDFSLCGAWIGYVRLALFNSILQNINAIRYLFIFFLCCVESRERKIQLNIFFSLVCCYYYSLLCCALVLFIIFFC